MLMNLIFSPYEFKNLQVSQLNNLVILVPHVDLFWFSLLQIHHNFVVINNGKLALRIFTRLKVIMLIFKGNYMHYPR